MSARGVAMETRRDWIVARFTFKGVVTVGGCGLANDFLFLGL